MKELAWFALLVVLPLGCGGKAESSKTDPREKPAKPAETREEAIAAIKKLGGRVFSVSKNSGLVDYVLFNNPFETNVTDAGLVHLKTLTSLDNLDLSTTKITAAGLVHLKGSAKLRTLYLEDTKVTAAGVKKLQDALPKCEIQRW